MDSQMLINALAAISLAGIGWWLNNLWQMVKSLQEQISAVHVKMVEHYAPRAELQATFQRLFEKLDEIQRELNK